MIELRKNIFFKIFSVLLSFTVMFYMSPMTLKAMVDIASVKENREDLKSKNEELKKKIQEIEGQVQDKEAYAKVLQEQIDVLQKQVSLISDNVDSLNSEVDSLQKKIDINEKKVNDEVTKLKDMLADMYMTEEEISLWQILLSCKDPKEFIDTFPLILMANKSKAELVDQINKDTDQIKEDVDICKKKRKKVEEEKESLESKNQELKDANEKVQQVVKDLNQDKNEAEHELDINSAEIRALDEQEAEYYRQQCESAKAQIKNEISSDKSIDDISNASDDTENETKYLPPKKSGGYIRPVEGPITSHFGVYESIRNGRSHSGIDIGASSGTPIKAAQAGTVIFAGWNGGYGKCVIIDHGGGCSTLYAHMSSIGVSKDQFVSQGQIIGRVGVTGHTDGGAHLHFETRRYVNGHMEREDPEQYV